MGSGLEVDLYLEIQPQHVGTSYVLVSLDNYPVDLDLAILHELSSISWRLSELLAVTSAMQQKAEKCPDGFASSNKRIATSNKCLTSRNKKLVETSAML